MAIDINALYVYRIIPIQNLESDLLNGLFSKNKTPVDKNRVVIGNTEIIAGQKGSGMLSRNVCERLCSILFLNTDTNAAKY